MIEKMKKGTFLVYHKEYDAFLEQLRACGVVHISEKQKGATSEKLLYQLTAEKHLKQSISFLEKRLKKDQKPQRQDDGKTAVEALERFDNLIEEKDKNTQQRQYLQKEIDRLNVWGNFDLELLDKIGQAGYFLKFYTVREKFFQKKWEEDFNAIVLAHVGSNIYFATLTHFDRENEPEAERFKLPEYALSDLRQQLGQTNQRLYEIEQELDSLALNSLNLLKSGQIDYQNEIELSKVRLNTSAEIDDKLMLLEGWLPVKKEAAFRKEMENGNACFFLEEPTEHDNPPVLLKNNRFAKLYEVVGELYDLPNYHEMDLTAFFAPFYWMFFGLCFGDAGYGLLVMIVGLIMRNRVKPKMRSIMSLAAWLGGGAVIFGTISGTFFGVELLHVQWAWLDNLKTIMLDSNQLFWAALIIGVVQIIFAMFLKAFGQMRRYGFAASLDTWGWLLLIVGNIVVFVLNRTVLHLANPNLIHIIISGIAAVLILMLNNIKRNILVNIGSGLWNTYNMITGLLGDVLSYIRLFALGISGSVMGFVFNDLAFNLSPDVPVVGHIVTALILVFGHGINIFMSGLSAIVHPMRLTFVEFYKNAGFEGGGKKYKPFKIINEE
ncbi:MAG: ATPase [Bacteroidales bacterium]|jgi:V/A-type H+-transporting ATPase subunit I|nr:ATPase [Bacteroidales bacterium]